MSMGHRAFPHAPATAGTLRKFTTTPTRCMHGGCSAMQLCAGSTVQTLYAAARYRRQASMCRSSCWRSAPYRMLGDDCDMGGISVIIWMSAPSSSGRKKAEGGGKRREGVSRHASNNKNIHRCSFFSRPFRSLCEILIITIKTCGAIRSLVVVAVNLQRLAASPLLFL